MVLGHRAAELSAIVHRSQVLKLEHRAEMS